MKATHTYKNKLNQTAKCLIIEENEGIEINEHMQERKISRVIFDGDQSCSYCVFNDQLTKI